MEKWLFLYLLLGFAPWAFGGSQPAESTAIASLERSMEDAKTKHMNGAVSEEALDSLRDQLAEARSDRARLRGDTEGTIEYLTQMIELRSLSLRRIQAALIVGARSEADLDEAEERLAQARLDLAKAQGDAKEMIRQLRSILEKRQKALERSNVLYQTGMASKHDAGVVENRWKKAREELAAAQTEAEKKP